MISLRRYSLLWLGFLLYFCITPPRCRAQEWMPKFEQIMIRDGLPQNDVVTTVQDSIGFLWFATHNGLCRYDGYDFVRFKNRYDSDNTIGSNVLLSMTCDAKGRLWIGTKDGLDCYDPCLDRFVNYRDTLLRSYGRTNHCRVTAVAPVGDGSVCFGIDNRLYLFQEERGFEFGVVRHPGTGAQPTYISVLHEAPYDRIYVATNRGLYLCNTKNFRSDLLFLPSAHQPGRSDKLTALLTVPASGELLVGGAAGLFRIRPDGSLLGEVLFEGHPIKKISALCRDSDGRLWVGTEDNGLFLVGERRMIHCLHDPRDPSSIGSNEVLSIFEDRSGVVWVGTSTGGVCKFSLQRKRFAHLFYDPYRDNGLSDPVVRSVYADADSIVWVGTKEGVLNRWDRRSGDVQSYPLRVRGREGISCRIQAIEPAGANELWIGCGQGLLLFDKRQGRFCSVPRVSEQINVFVSALSRDHSGNLWCGTGDGVYVVRNREVVACYNTRGVDGVPLNDNRVTAICCDGHGAVWIGTRDGGLNRLVMRSDSCDWRCYMYDRRDSMSISYNDISSLFEDSKGRLWVGTWGGGLNLFDGKSGFRTYTEEDGLADNVVFSIREDGLGRLWMSTYNGLSCLQPETGVFTNYSSYDGTGNDEYMQGAVCKDADGMLFLGGLNGWTVFRPEEITSSTFSPRVALTALRFFGSEERIGTKESVLDKALFATRRLCLPYNKRNFTLDFAAFSYAAPLRNRFAYKLEGFDDNWLYTTRGVHSAFYANLKPGEYVFLLRGGDFDGPWSEPPVRLEIRIAPPFWMSGWAYMIYFLVAGGLLGGLWHYYRRRVEMRNAMLRARLHEEGQQKLYESKMRFYTNVSHELRTPLTLILGLTNRIAEQLGPESMMAEQLVVMKRNADLLLRRVNELLTLRKIETQHMKVERKPCEVVSFTGSVVSFFEENARSSGIRLEFRSVLEHFNMDIDSDKTEKILYNLLSNAVKFTHTRVDVLLEVVEAADDRWLRISVADDGPGVSFEDQAFVFDRFFQCKGVHSSDTGTGIGLNMAQELARLQGGVVSVESELGHGACFRLELPVVNGDILDVSNDAVLSDEELSSDDSVNLPILLVVDDNADMRYYLKELLSDEYDVRTADCGITGLEMASRIIPDVILSDVMMPDIEGTELFARLKSNPSTSHIPVIFLTAKYGEDARVQGLKLGADAYITKPFSDMHLRAQIANTLRLREEIRIRLHREVLMTPAKVVLESSSDKLLVNVIAQIEAHISDENYDVNSLCKDVGISRMHLYRKLKGLVGQTPGDLIRDFRIKRAADLLQQRKFTVSEIAYMVGFSDLKNFRQVFRKKYGMSPSEYANCQPFVDKSASNSEQPLQNG